MQRQGDQQAGGGNASEGSVPAHELSVHVDRDDMRDSGDHQHEEERYVQHVPEREYLRIQLIFVQTSSRFQTSVRVASRGACNLLAVTQPRGRSRARIVSSRAQSPGSRAISREPCEARRSINAAIPPPCRAGDDEPPFDALHRFHQPRKVGDGIRLRSQPFAHGLQLFQRLFRAVHPGMEPGIDVTSDDPTAGHEEHAHEGDVAVRGAEAEVRVKQHEDGTYDASVMCSVNQAEVPPSQRIHGARLRAE